MTIDEIQSLWELAKTIHEARIDLAWGSYDRRPEPWPAVDRNYTHSPIAYVDLALASAKAVRDKFPPWSPPSWLMVTPDREICMSEAEAKIAIAAIAADTGETKMSVEIRYPNTGPVYVRINTLEEFLSELLEWLRQQSANPWYKDTKNQMQRHANYAVIETYRRMIDFWTEVEIREPKP